MRNWIVKAVVALTSALVAAPASALKGTNGVDGPPMFEFGSCSVYVEDTLDPMNLYGYAGVEVIVNNNQNYWSGSSYWYWDEVGGWRVVTRPGFNVTVDLIADCLSLDPDSVSSLNTVGATGTSGNKLTLAFRSRLLAGRLTRQAHMHITWEIGQTP